MENYNQSNELYHYGRKGMKWGQSIFGGIHARKVAKQRRQNLEKARAARAANKKAQAEKEEILRTGNTKAILKNKDKFTNEELQRAINRLNMEKQLKDLNVSQRTRGQRFINKYIDSTVDKIADGVMADLTAQAIKAVANKGVNAGVNALLKTSGTEYVYTNNKKKS